MMTQWMEITRVLSHQLVGGPMKIMGALAEMNTNEVPVDCDSFESRGSLSRC